MCQCIIDWTLDYALRGKKLGYALPMKTDYEETQNWKRYNVKDCRIMLKIIKLRELMNLNVLVNCFQ